MGHVKQKSALEYVQAFIVMILLWFYLSGLLNRL